MGFTVKWKAAPSSVYSGRSGKKIEWIIVHYTATNASAYNNALYMSRGGSGSGSWHYCLDENDIYQAVAEKDCAWCCGNYDLNQRSINIEVVNAGGDFTEKTIEKLSWLVQDIMRRRGIKADHVIRHNDNYRIVQMMGYTGRTTDPGKKCPAGYVDNNKWLALRNRITGASASVNTSENPRVGATDVKAYFYAKGTSAVIRKLTDFNNLSNNKIVGTIPKGDYAPLTGNFCTVLLGSYQYIEVNYRGTVGYVQADFTTKDGDTNYLLCSEPEKL